MRHIIDLHIHSRYSRACSPALTFPNLDHWCRKKGITMCGTGDFTHPKWFTEMEEHLEPAGNGLYQLKKQFLSFSVSQFPVYFVPTAEVSCIYKRGGKARRVHNIIVAPDFATVKKINTRLAAIGNIHSDGRPILGLDSEELAKIVFDASPACLLIPAHAWTPWFAVFGSQSGFDSLEECFGSMTKHIHAIETGLSSDPAMNRRLSALDRIVLVSNSDAHSLENLGREANVLDIAPGGAGPGSAGDNVYAEFMRIIHERDAKCFLYTIEFFPEEGKYHLDGHRACAVRATPEETKRWKGICPKCKRELTVGVLHRVAVLADRPEGGASPQAIPYKSIVPLQEIIAEALGVGKHSKKVQEEYERIVAHASEFSVLIDTPLSEIARMTAPDIVEGIRRVRAGQLAIEPGYDGEYGTVRVFRADEQPVRRQQVLL
ncbi:DNA helicase UvrD [Candidatus Uhrbacteria bacterium]|nr:DNA helicase UvrD [Candidatus Uhrbacteria bacterium]